MRPKVAIFTVSIQSIEIDGPGTPEETLADLKVLQGRMESGDRDSVMKRLQGA